MCWDCFLLSKCCLDFQFSNVRLHNPLRTSCKPGQGSNNQAREQTRAQKRQAYRQTSEQTSSQVGGRTDAQTSERTHQETQRESEWQPETDRGSKRPQLVSMCTGLRKHCQEKRIHTTFAQQLDPASVAQIVNYCLPSLLTIVVCALNPSLPRVSRLPATTFRPYERFFFSRCAP